MNPSRHFGRNP